MSGQWVHQFRITVLCCWVYVKMLQESLWHKHFQSNRNGREEMASPVTHRQDSSWSPVSVSWYTLRSVDHEVWQVGKQRLCFCILVFCFFFPRSICGSQVFALQRHMLYLTGVSFCGWVKGNNSLSFIYFSRLFCTREQSEVLLGNRQSQEQYCKQI